jgi:DNA polymerase-4
MDAFFASVEQRDKPQYRGKPLVVGGSPYQRGVVAAASYEAREFGIHSAMPSKTALQRCPQLIFVQPRFDAYKAVSAQIHEIFHRYTDLVEPLSLDEAYLDVTINKMAMPSATLIAREIKERIFAETGLTASAGVSINKFLAKTASSVRKPNGLYLIPPAQAVSYVEELEIEKFYGVGDATAEKMHQMGIFTGRDLKAYSEMELVKRFGKAGSFYYQIARGQDNRLVVADRVRKSIGAEESYADDLQDGRGILEALGNIADVLLRRLQKLKTSGRTLTLKVKYADYQQHTRSKTFANFIDTNSVSQIVVCAQELLRATEAEQRFVRLLGLTVSNLELDLANQEEPVQLKLELTRL